jgi:hypothetical protein
MMFRRAAASGKRQAASYGTRKRASEGACWVLTPTGRTGTSTNSTGSSRSECGGTVMPVY